MYVTKVVLYCMSQNCVCVVMWESRNSKGEILSGFQAGGAVEPVTTHLISTEYNAGYDKEL